MFHNLLLLIWIPGCQTHATNFTYFQLDRGTRNISQVLFTCDYCRFLNNTVCKRYFGEIEGYAKKELVWNIANLLMIPYHNSTFWKIWPRHRGLKILVNLSAYHYYCGDMQNYRITWAKEEIINAKD